MRTVTTILALLILLLTACSLKEDVAPQAAIKALPTSTLSSSEIATQLISAQPLPQHTVIEMIIRTKVRGEEIEPLVLFSEESINGEGNRHSVVYQTEQKEVMSIEVRNDNKVWSYEAHENSYTETTLSDDAPFGLLFSSTIPEMIEQASQQMWHSFDFAFLGHEEVAGRQTYKWQLVPKGQAKQMYSIFGTIEETIWVDVETWQLLKHDTKGKLGQTTITTIEIEYNPDFPEDIFTFVPPEGAIKKEAPSFDPQITEP